MSFDEEPEDIHAECRAEIKRLQGIKPELPEMPPAGEGLPRYGLRWNGPQLPLAVPMPDGYWTPWHLADKEVRDTTWQDHADRWQKRALKAEFALRQITHGYDDGVGSAYFSGKECLEIAAEALKGIK